MSSSKNSQPQALDPAEDASISIDATVHETAEGGPSEEQPARHHQHHDHRKRRRSRPSGNDAFSTWTHISLDRSDATLHAVSADSDERSGSERCYHRISGVDEPWEIISHVNIKAMEDADAKAESEDGDDDDEEGWVLVEK